MAPTSADKLKSDYCEKIVKKKYTKNVHGEGIKSQFLSISSVDIRDVFAAPPPPRITEIIEEEEQELQEGKGCSRIYDDSSQSAKQTKYILDQLESLHLKVDQLEKQGSSKFGNNTTDLSSVLTEINVLDLLKTCRSIEIILSLVTCLTIKNVSADEGLFCTVCEFVRKYNFECGLSFDFSENLPSSLFHLKESVKRHSEYYPQKVSTEQEVLYKQSNDVAINCALAAYMSYKLGLSHATYENLEIHTSGGNIGQKNRSKEFSRNVLGPMYEVLRN